MDRLRPCYGAVTTWLAGSASDRARFADMHARLGYASAFGALLGGAHALAAIQYGWPMLVLVIIAAATMRLGILVTRMAQRPEPPSLLTFALLEANLLAAVVMTGGARSPLLALTLVPVFTQAVCFRPAVSTAATGMTAVMAVLASLIGARLPQQAVSPGYLEVACYVAVLLCLGIAANQLADSDRRARGYASLDPLTGLYNRRAIGAHFNDLRARAGSQAQVGIVAIDVDHFKAVNDSYGHDRGDAVLMEIAARLTCAMRAEDLLHRVGGEEFLMLCPDADARTSMQIAERMRAAVADAPVCGLIVSVSVGASSGEVAASTLENLMKMADNALYEAKEAGRNRVVMREVEISR